MSSDKLLKLASTFLNKAEDLLKSAKEKASDPKAKIRNRGDVVFPAESPNVKDNNDHFPINNINQARNALARANQYLSVPEWYKGSLKSLVNTVVRKVKAKYPSIEISQAAKKPGKD